MDSINKHILFLFIALMVSSGFSVAAQQPPENLVLATPGSSSNLYIRWATAVNRMALKQLNYTLTIRHCEPLHCSDLAKQGAIDGELVRHASYQKYAPELIRLNVSLFNSTWAAYGTNLSRRFNSWSELSNSRLKTGYMRGSAFVPDHMTDRASETQLVKIRHWKNGLVSLRKGDLDLYIAPQEIMVEDLKLAENRAIHLVGVIDKQPIFTYLNQKHSDLAVKLSLVIAEMKKRGAIEQIYLQLAAD